MSDLVRYGSYDFPAGTTAVIGHPVTRNPNGPRIADAETWTVSGWLAPSSTYAVAETAHAALVSGVAADGKTLSLVDTAGASIRAMPTFAEDTNGAYVVSVDFSEPVAVWGTAFSVAFTNVAPDGGQSTTAREKLLQESNATASIETDGDGLMVQRYSGSFVGTRSATYALLKQHLSDLVLSKIGDATIRSFRFDYDLFRQRLTFDIVALISVAPTVLSYSETFALQTTFNIVTRRKPRGGAPVRYQVGDFIHVLRHQIQQEGSAAYPTAVGVLLGFEAKRTDAQETSWGTPRLDSHRRPVGFPLSESYTYELNA